jgi:hypothetical protein
MHWVFWLYAVAMTMVYPLGIPLFYWYLYWKHGDEMQKLRDLESRLAATRESLQVNAKWQADLTPNQRGAARWWVRWVRWMLRLPRGSAHAEPVLRGEEAKAIFTKLTAAEEKLAEQEKQLQTKLEMQRGCLPDYMQRLIGGFEFRVHWFESFECFRKLMLVGAPVFFDPPGSVQQLMYGLMVSFILFGVSSVCTPYTDPTDDRLASICQLQIFFALLSSVANSFDDSTLRQNYNMDVLLCICTLVPLVVTVITETPIPNVLAQLHARLARGGVTDMQWPHDKESAPSARSSTVHPRSESELYGQTKKKRLIKRLGQKTRILIGFFQILSPLGIVYSIPFPPVYESMVRWFNVLQLNFIEFMPLACIFDTSYHTILVLRTLMPLLALGIFYIVRLAILCQTGRAESEAVEPVQKPTQAVEGHLESWHEGGTQTTGTCHSTENVGANVMANALVLSNRPMAGACKTKLTKAVHVEGKHVSSRIDRLTISRAVMDDEKLASSAVLDAARTDGGVLPAREQAETKSSLDVIQTRIPAAHIKRAQPLPLIPDTLGRSISSIRPLTVYIQSASRQGASATQTCAMPESEAVCHRVCIQWWNHRLSQRGLCVCDLPSDVRSGELVHALVELVTGAIPGINRAHGQTAMSGAWYQSNTRSERVDPASPRGRLISAMNLLRSSGIPISTRSSKRVTAGGPHGTTMRLVGMDEYVEMATALEFGSWPAIKSLTWSLILHTDVWVGLQSSAEALADLLQWVRDTVKSYKGVIVGRTRHAWSTSFSSGLVWCALVHAHDEDLLNYREMLPAEPEVRLRTVFALASEHLGVPELSSPQDVLTAEPRVAIIFTANLRNAMRAAATSAFLLVPDKRDALKGDSGGDSDGDSLQQHDNARQPPTTPVPMSFGSFL